jgi:hypothetical protein
MAFTFKLECEDGTPAEPPVLHTAVPNWSAGDTIPLSAERVLRVVEVRSSTADENPVLVVEPISRRPRLPKKEARAGYGL